MIIKPKRSYSSSSGAPTASDIVDGEIAIDMHGQNLYINDSGTIKLIGGSASSYSDADVNTHLNTGTASSGEVLSWTGTDYDWVAQTGGSSGISNVVEDTTPQLGGNLDVNGNDIVTISNGNIELDPNGSGLVVFKGNSTKGSGQFKLNCENNSHGITIKGPPHSAGASYTLTLPNNDGNTDQVLRTDGSGVLSWVNQTGGATTTVYQYTDAGMSEFEYTASANQTTFSGSDTNSATLGYAVDSIMVFLNGVLQDDTVDYTATNGTSVVFTSALAANDEVRIIAVSSTATLHNPTKLDAITTVNGQAAYSLTVGSSAYTPSHENALTVSVNGITQEPGNSFTVSGSTITFSPALATGDVVNYIIDMGRKINITEAFGYATVDDATALAIALG